ncbi:uncharacterized protein RSE6_04468 [Rhynchosporium secalis]|uniref:Uncharacterized protein n=1 Tax=Rhynchosporium secalis TaxID=38038 RepID=A0A1E1M6Q4_RHYSE|nr:uncharacterized protein RSE6_04468 [Rhynchosporium secalis]
MRAICQSVLGMSVLGKNLLLAIFVGRCSPRENESSSCSSPPTNTIRIFQIQLTPIMKLSILSALFISGALSAAVNGAGLEARSSPLCSCSLKMTNGNEVLDQISNKDPGLTNVRSKVVNGSQKIIGYCNLIYNRVHDCTQWTDASRATGPLCSLRKEPLKCFPVSGDQ